MKKTLLALTLGVLATNAALAKTFDMNQAEPFTGKVLVEGLQGAWDMQIDRNGLLWITEVGGNIATIDPNTGARTLIHHFDDVVNGGIQQGLLGFDFAPNFLAGKGANALYAAYAYKATDGKEYTKIVKVTLDAKAQKASKVDIVLDKLASYTDHQGGRLRLGGDGKLYYTIGNQGANQYANTCKPDNAQRLPTAKEVSEKDWLEAYQGKTLRLNTDGSIPSDNPTLNGVQSHVYTYGHRNPQGLVFVGDKLFQEEQGPGSDDEVNLLEAGANYGWPHVAGYADNQNYTYTSYATAEKCKELPETIGDTKFETVGGEAPNKMVAQKETDFKQESNYRDPLKTFFTVRNGHNLFDKNCPDSSYLCWPTAALSSIAYYPKEGKVKNWQNSILVSGLKSGGIYRMPLNATSDDVQGELYKHFSSNNRYRNVTVNHDGSKIYVITDNGGSSQGLDGKQNMTLQNNGAILVFEAQ